MKFKNPREIKKAHAQYALRQCSTLDNYPKIQGYDFEKGLDFPQFLKAYSQTGFQATHLAQGIEIIRSMRREKACIFLGFTSNITSSGLRDIIKYLVKHKKVDILVTSAGGIEEDIIKSLKPFVLGQFEVSGQLLFEHGINRTGNIFVPNDRFAYFDQFMQNFLQQLYAKQKKEGKIYHPRELIRELGLAIKDENSFLYWAAKNNLPVFCPGLIDGSLGDMIYFFKQSHPDFILDISREIKEIVDLALNAEKTGALILGGGISKHFILNANIFREGLDFVVYVNTAQEFDGSDSGARIEEAISWGKIKPKAPAVKIHGDASIVFPLLVAGSFAQEKEDKSQKIKK